MNINEVAFKEYFHRIYELLETDRARIADIIEDNPDLTDLADRLEYELEAGHGEWASEVNESYNGNYSIDYLIHDFNKYIIPDNEEKILILIIINIL